MFLNLCKTPEMCLSLQTNSQARSFNLLPGPNLSPFGFCFSKCSISKFLPTPTVLVSVSTSLNLCFLSKVFIWPTTACFLARSLTAHIEKTNTIYIHTIYRSHLVNMVNKRKCLRALLPPVCLSRLATKKKMKLKALDIIPIVDLLSITRWTVCCQSFVLSWKLTIPDLMASASIVWWSLPLNCDKSELWQTVLTGPLICLYDALSFTSPVVLLVSHLSLASAFSSCSQLSFLVIDRWCTEALQTSLLTSSISPGPSYAGIIAPLLVGGHMPPVEVNCQVIVHKTTWNILYDWWLPAKLQAKAFFTVILSWKVAHIQPIQPYNSVKDASCSFNLYFPHTKSNFKEGECFCARLHSFICSRQNRPDEYIEHWTLLLALKVTDTFDWNSPVNTVTETPEVYLCCAKVGTNFEIEPCRSTDPVILFLTSHVFRDTFWWKWSVPYKTLLLCSNHMWSQNWGLQEEDCSWILHICFLTKNVWKSKS